MEFLDVVNEHDEVIGRASQADVYRLGLLHRIVHVIVMNNSGEMALQLRSKTKSFLPGHWCTTAGGHVQSGETYEQAARRELQEETGMIPKNLDFLRKDVVVYLGHGVTKLLSTFCTVHDGPIGADGVEVEKVEYFSLDRIRDMVAAGEPFHPELLIILRGGYGI